MKPHILVQNGTRVKYKIGDIVQFINLFMVSFIINNRLTSVAKVSRACTKSMNLSLLSCHPELSKLSTLR